MIPALIKEKHKPLIFIIFISFIFIILRFPSLFEPNWYGDEGIYQVIGFGLRSGRQFYTGVWDNKPPLLFVIYALVNGDQFGARLLSLLSGLSALLPFYLLAGKLFKSHKAVYASTIFFSIFFGLPILEGNIANAENFMLFPIISASYLLYSLFCSWPKDKSNYNLKIILAGLFLSIAFLIKIVAVFDLMAFVTFIIFLINYSDTKINISYLLNRALQVVRPVVLLILSFLLPILISVIFFLFSGLLFFYLDAAFGRNVDYVGYANWFIIPQGLLYLRVLILGLFLIFMFIKRANISRSSLFIYIWLSFALFNAFFSNRPYTHYQLNALPVYSLLVGLFFNANVLRQKIKTFILLSAIAIIAVTHFVFWSIPRNIEYYVNFYNFITGRKDFNAYQSFFDPRNVKDYQIAMYIKEHTKPKDIVFLWGNSAQIYRLSNTLPPGRYSAAYHIISTKYSYAETAQAINKNKPKYIIITKDLPTVPFDISGYIYKLSIQDTLIYARAF